MPANLHLDFLKCETVVCPETAVFSQTSQWFHQAPHLKLSFASKETPKLILEVCFAKQSLERGFMKPTFKEKPPAGGAALEDGFTKLPLKGSIITEVAVSQMRYVIYTLCSENIFLCGNYLMTLCNSVTSRNIP